MFDIDGRPRSGGVESPRRKAPRLFAACRSHLGARPAVVRCFFQWRQQLFGTSPSPISIT
jgi:hypothetical protein